MSAEITLLNRPTRWQQPFGQNMTDSAVARVLESEPIVSLDAENFPASTSLADILRFDARLVSYEPGQIIVREQEYGNSAFAVISGQVKVILDEGLPDTLLGRTQAPGKSYWEAFSQLWRNNQYAEARRLDQTQIQVADDTTKVTMKNFEQVFADFKTADLGSGALFGELAALGRMPRTATVVASQATELLEIRWQGIREIMRFDKNFKQSVESKYRENALFQHLAETSIFKNLPDEAFNELVKKALFETHGSFDWYIDYGRGKHDEPTIAKEGDYPDGLIIVRAGFARVSRNFGASQQTLTYLSAGDLYGLHEVYEQSQGKETRLETNLNALGYVDLIRVPLPLLEKYVFPKIEIPKQRLIDYKNAPLQDTVADDWLIDNRFMNATQAMVINLDKCVRCDDCVRACSSTHDGNPRFKRHGKTYNNWMVANACMHCVDPVCMIGCPTGAIHRTSIAGQVVINDDACIGCGTCANSCPYENITLVEISDQDGKGVLDSNTHRPLQKATKCDLCYTNPGGPACVAACPHDALFRTGFDGENILSGRS